MGKKQENKKYWSVVSVLIIALGIYSFFNWLPRPGWVTKQAQYFTPREVEFYVGPERYRATVPGGSDYQRRENRASDSQHTKIQYNPDDPNEIRMAPSWKQLLLSVALTGGGTALFRYNRKH